MIYFIRAGNDGPVKIGYAANNVADRLRTLQAGNHLRLCLLRTIPGGKPAEAWLHRHFREHRIDREWFSLVPEMLVIEPPADLPPATLETLPIVLEAARLVGGTAILCRHLGCTRQALSQWRKVPRGRAVEIEHLTERRISRHDMRPDLFPRKRAS